MGNAHPTINVMTRLSLLFSFFPTFILLLVLSSLSWLILQPSLFSFLTLFICLYGFPLIIYRIHQHFYPIPEGISYLKGKEYSPWWGSQQIQLIYNTFPFLEKILHLVPGLFSFWLRLWGAEVGKNVYWVPNVHILDRGLMKIGDNVLFGYNVQISAHAIKPKKDNFLLYVKRIEISSNVFVSGDVKIGPGVEVEEGAFIPYGKTISLRKKFKAKDKPSQLLALQDKAIPQD